ncbi:hypothetical protein TSOC_002218 [Tetrabaena socialis]|uniref:Uncharacterized protein n=1 Tax=Tetrabaena socialis TaxID=47790 RepID=A0A2J8AEL9_9CHLO|nr:hypothetical protein TSOC_002218 [Tetrabaena socialis]|eukprot:PNH10968.1 hypothetical protein TSOC_002218 [Tetrabaena socialis]
MPDTVQRSLAVSCAEHESFVELLGSGSSVPDAHLASLFGFTHLPAAELQSEGAVAGLCSIVRDFVQQLSTERGGNTPAHDGDAAWPDVPPEDMRVLLAVAAALSSDRVAWFPKYGCALLALGGSLEDGAPADDDVRPRPEHLDLQLVALDEWAFRMHSSKGLTQRTAASDTYVLLSCGRVAADRYDHFRSRCRALEARGNEERQRGGKSAQRTPGFMLAVIDSALATLDMADEEFNDHLKGGAVKPRGGFTDVGQHTGGDATRSTAWPLVMAVTQALLECGGVCRGAQQQPQLLFRQAAAHLDLWLLHRQLTLETPQTATPVAQSALMHMLRSATGKAAELAAEGHDMAAFEASCSDARRRVQALAGNRALLVGCEYELPAAGSAGSAVRPAGTLPPVTDPRAEAGGLEAARRRAEVNLGSLPLLPRGASFSQMLELLQQPQWAQPDRDVGAQLALRSVERELFGRAAGGFGAARKQQLPHAEVAALEQVVDAYRAIVRRFLQSEASAAVMRVELLSREVLVV